MYLKTKTSKQLIILSIFFLFFNFISFFKVSADEIELPHQLNSKINKLASVEDTEKIELLIEIAKEYEDLDSSKAIEYSKEAVILATDLNKTELIMKSKNSLGFSYLAFGSYQKSKETFLEVLELPKANSFTITAGYTYTGLGISCDYLSCYGEALEYFKESLTLFEKASDKEGIAVANNNLGNINLTFGDFESSLNYFLTALKINEELKDSEEIGTTLNNIGMLYYSIGELEKASDYYFQAIVELENSESDRKLSAALINIASIMQDQKNYNEAMEFYLKAFQIEDKLKNKAGIATILNNIGSLYEATSEFEASLESYTNALGLRLSIDDKEGSANSYNNIGTVLYKLQRFQDALSYHSKALELSMESQYKEGMKSSLYNMANDYFQLGDYKSAYEQYSLYSNLKDNMFNEDYAESISLMETRFETEKKEHRIDILSKDKQIQQIIIMLTGAILLAVSILGLIIAKERKKSEKLLLNILPKRVADELKAKGFTVPESFDEVTIYFSDIVSFTKTSSTLEPDFLISELSDIFTNFDSIMEKHNCERIKTIGDAYFGICGLPTANPKNAYNIASAAMDILDYLNERNSTRDLKWRIRIGIHTGKVVGGVVGTKKYIYDVFGDTVNTASRMESNGSPMRINVSEETYQILKDDFIFTQREPLEVKGKGLYSMYFLEEKILNAEEEKAI